MIDENGSAIAEALKEDRVGVRTYNCSRTPNIPDVYSVLVNIHGEVWPRRPGDPEVYAYWDGVDRWSYWGFSIDEARRAKMCPSSVRYPWRQVGEHKNFV